jgi:hypothetical protein
VLKQRTRSTRIISILTAVIVPNSSSVKRLVKTVGTISNSKFFNFATIVMSMFLGASAIAKSGGQDSNPYNFENWQVMPKTGSHTVTGYGWSKWADNVVHQDEFNFQLIPSPPTNMATSANNSSDVYHSCTMKAVAEASIHWKWIGVGVMPAKVWVLKTATADAIANPSVGPVALSVDNGLESPVVTINEGGGIIHIRSTGTKLVEVQTSGDGITVPFSVSAEASSVRPSAPYSNGCSATVGFGIELKGIRLTNRGTYIKQPSNWTRLLSPYNETHAVWSQSTVTYEGQSVEVYSKNETFGASKFGPWVDPFHTWAGSGLVWTDDLFNERNTQVMGFVVPTAVANTIPESSPWSTNITLKVKDLGPDQDSTELSDEHKLFVYAPLMHSNIYHLGLNTYVTPTSFAVNAPGYASAGGSVGFTFGERAVIWDIFNYASGTIDVATAFAKNPWLKAIAKVISITNSHYQPQPQTGVAPWAWGWENSTYEGSPNPPFPPPIDYSQWGTVFQNWRMTPKFEDKYTQKFVEAEEYGGDGYVGRSVSMANVLSGARHSGDFYLVGGGGGSGGQGSNPGA